MDISGESRGALTNAPPLEYFHFTHAVSDELPPRLLGGDVEEETPTSVVDARTRRMNRPDMVRVDLVGWAAERSQFHIRFWICTV